MKQGRCPRCDSQEIYSGADVYPKSGPFTSNAIPVSLTSIAALDNYVCGQCGYVERYIADQKKLVEITKKWRRIDPNTEN